MPVVRGQNFERRILPEAALASTDMNMPGIEFLIDRNGRKKAVLIDLKKHKGLWEDLFDAYVAHQRRGEPRDSLAAVKRLVVAKAKRKARG